VPGLFLVSSAAIVVSAMFNAERTAVVRAGVIFAIGVILFGMWNKQRAGRDASS
jgi:hypothetical protein